jgi:proteasome accessory factor B
LGCAPSQSDDQREDSDGGGDWFHKAILLGDPTLFTPIWATAISTLNTVSATKTERLLNLTMALLATSRYLTKGEIFDRVAGYKGAPDANDRMFERDKDDLRELGIPLITGRTDPAMEQDDGYRIDSKAYSLPAISFTSREASVVTLAAQIWREMSFANPAHSALLKLQAGGENLTGDELFEAHLSGMEPAFPTIWEGVKERRRIAFDYRRRDGKVSHREVEPWGILSWRGGWYLVGMDLGRKANRVFRLSRLTSQADFISKSGAFEPPEGLDLRKEIERSNSQASQVALLNVVRGTCMAMRRRSLSSKNLNDEWDQIEVDFTDLESFSREILWLAQNVVVVEPEPLKSRVMGSLRTVAR